MSSSPSLSDKLAAESAALLRVVAEGLLAIYERQRTAVLITAQIP